MIASMPHGDWQFWVVTGLAAAALLFLARPIWLPLVGIRKRKQAN